MSFYIEIAALLVSIVMLVVLFRVLKSIVRLAINSAIAIAAIFLLNFIFGFGIIIDIWSVAIVALSGIPGLILVLALHFLHLAF